MSSSSLKRHIPIASWGFACLFSVLQTACFNSSFVPPAADPGSEEKSSKVEISSGNVADGITPAQISAWLRHSNGNPIVGVQMNISALGTGVVVVPCTVSDSVGFTRCKIYSTSAGKKIVSLVGPVTLKLEIDFIVPEKVQGSFGVVAGASMESTVGGNKIIATSGIVETPVNLKDNAGRDRLHSSLLSTIIND